MLVKGEIDMSEEKKTRGGNEIIRGAAGGNEGPRPMRGRDKSGRADATAELPDVVESNEDTVQGLAAPNPVKGRTRIEQDFEDETRYDRKMGSLRTRDDDQPDPEDAGQSGDTQGLSAEDDVDSESVRELAEEGQDYEAEIVSAIENAPLPEDGPLRTRVSPDDADRPLKDPNHPPTL
jgi:hypothetical protein